jgi:hypothetical protein
MDNKSSPLFMDAEMTAAGAAVIQGGFDIVTIDKTRKTDDLMDALKNNRARLQVLKADYVKAVLADGGVQNAPSSKRRAVFHELMRTYGAMEGLKNELTQRGANFEIDVNDHEHPNAALKRLTTPVSKPNSFGLMFWYLLISVIVLLLWFVTSDIWQQMWHFGQERSTSLGPRR